MCYHTYHHYCICGHICNWTVDSCQEFTNKMLLATSTQSCSCPEIQIAHDLADPTQSYMCVQCEYEWTRNISPDNQQAGTYEAISGIEGLDVAGPLVTIEARLVSKIPLDIFENAPSGDLNTAFSADNEDQSDAFLEPFYDLVDTFQSSRVRRTDTLSSRESGCSTSPLLHESRAETYSSSLDLPPDLVDSFVSSLSTSDYFTSSYDSSDYDISSEGSTDESPDNVEEEQTWRYALMEAGIIKPPTTTDSRIRSLDDPTDDIHAERPNTPETDYESDCSFADALSYIASEEDDDYTETAFEEEYNPTYEWIANLERTSARIEATVTKRIEEDYERYRRQAIISSLLDKASFFKDQIDKRDQNTELGIEEDSHLWDTESMLEAPVTSSSPPALRPRPICLSNNKENTSPIARSPCMHVFDGIFSANSDQEAEEQGLFAFAPVANMPGEYEGFMEGHSAADAQEQGLQFPQHARGCCDKVPAPWHLYYGAVYAASKDAVKKRGIEEVQPALDQLGKYYGVMKADSKKHAIEMGMMDPQHARGCCIEAFFSIPPRTRHVYCGAMDAVSKVDAENMGMQQAQRMPDRLDEYYGFVEAFSLEEAVDMGLRDGQHAKGCCALGWSAAPERSQYLYYGYMFGPSEEAVVQNGLRDPLRIPGSRDKYSGVVSALSAEDARQMGMFEPLRVMWDSDVVLASDFEE
ncbi:uncharacterized protein N7511_006436 [Penicillium nucicola]|uniref:uncharacterized protein n=1 Tax=Penicillium nucicola TaxID=1850975 RepID=UPI002545BCA4|nr:uncharacterized protein N7511_006436 [Penicillium nucicola]KAJ5757742.1 hypothetical protein N7511_006436 [Penicillium nucicola]